jgi:methionyl-tRNA formyltransferase
LESRSETDRERCTVVFAGTPDFAVASLRELYAHPSIDVAAVYTQPDRPAGRGRRQQLSAVKQAANDLRLAVHQPLNFNDAEAAATFSGHRADVLVVAAYGLLLPRNIIDAAKLAVNVHASLLPRWRGAAPIQRCILANDQETGISMMRIVEALDAGPILARQRCTIAASETAGSLHDKLALLGASCLRATIDDYLEGRLTEADQDETKVSYAKKITPSDRPLEWTESAEVLERRIRALNPTPAATCRFGSVNIKVFSATPLRDPSRAAPGEIVAATHLGVDVATGDGILRITRLQPEGKKVMAAKDFVNGFKNLLFPT